MSSYRDFLKNQSLPGMSETETDQMKGLPLPPIEKPCPMNTTLIPLPAPQDLDLGTVSLIDIINQRRSRRKYTEISLNLEELSFLLWTTQGMQKLIRNDLLTLRTVPSGGGMHPFETYLFINKVDGLEPGIYRFIATQHKLLPINTNAEGLAEKIGEACNGQTFIGKGAVVFFWCARPYRTEWRYSEDSLKDILISVGHICQNLYLACESIDAGTCGILAYQQQPLEEIIEVDGEDEILLYLAPVGKIASG